MTIPPAPARCGPLSDGRIRVFAHSDTRFSYCLFVPAPDRGAQPGGLVVAIHDSERNFMECCDGLAAFGEKHRRAVLAPLFPGNVLGDGNCDGYKYLFEAGIRYDLLLNEMVDAVARATGCDASRFCLHGYSGGAQFAHRYLLLHPGRVLAASVGAPGEVTLLDPEADWWAGVRDIDALFGLPLDLTALRRVPVQLLVGDLDTQTEDLEPSPPSRYWRSDGERITANRIDRLWALERSLAEAGVTVQFELMPGVEHSAGAAAARTLAQRFFSTRIGQRP